jgi:hypothetical protein
MKMSHLNKSVHPALSSGFKIQLLPPELVSYRAMGPARFVIEVSGVPQKKYGILFPDTARNLCSKMPERHNVVMKELMEKEVIAYLIDGWRHTG